MNIQRSENNLKLLPSLLFIRWTVKSNSAVYYDAVLFLLYMSEKGHPCASIIAKITVGMIGNYLKVLNVCNICQYTFEGFCFLGHCVVTWGKEQSL